MPRYLLFFIALALAPGIAPAQSTGGERWFKVELLVFSNRFASSVSEQWEATPALEYPDAFRFLIDTDLVAANREKNRGESVVNEFGRQIITLPGGPAVDCFGRPLAQPAASPAEAAETGTLPLTPTPFVLLPATERTLGGKAAYMQRSGRYRTLFHEAWYQPFRDESNSLPVIIDRSGDTEDWPRLQGSVKFFLSRYLHIQTNLWLNTAGEYLPGTWQMPAPPFGPPQLILEDPMAAQDCGPGPADDKPASRPSTGFYAPGTSPSQSSDPYGLPMDPNAPDFDAGPRYPFRHAVLMQQKRRMRSTEVHYLDHPLLGEVVTITPVTEEELEARARSEAGLPIDAQTGPAS
jgi:hypothetical protein